MSFLARIVAALQKSTRQNELDDFIASKNPQNPADVDYWVRVFDQRMHSKTRSTSDYLNTKYFWD